MPFEFCQYGPCPEKCAQWFHENKESKAKSASNSTAISTDRTALANQEGELCNSTLKLIIDDSQEGIRDNQNEEAENDKTDTGKKHQTRGGKAVLKDPQLKEQREMEKRAVITPEI